MSEVPQLVDRLFRRESARLVASLTRVFGPAHLQLAEDVVQESLVRALELWPYQGVPDQPRAWLARVARNRGLDILRRRTNWQGKEQMIRGLETFEVETEEPAEGSVSDEELAMLFLSCHPELSLQDQVALTLKVAGGLSATEIASALLSNRKAVEQRLVRAKRRLRDRGASFDLPGASDLRGRLEAVHQVLYLIFTEGHGSATHGSWVRAELCREALRLAGSLLQAPGMATPEGHALAALFSFQSARLPARISAEGGIVGLVDQNRALWDGALIRRGLAHMERSAAGDHVTRYHVEAEIAAHWVFAEEPDWEHVERLYTELAELAPSPVVEVHRAVAEAKAGRPRAALERLAQVAGDKKMAGYVPFHVATAEVALLADEAGRAKVSFAAARDLAGDNALRQRMQERLDELK